uniref:ATP synthase F0 subunit 6 n=1 Tax=Posthodiplostomum centrarchi TaxID=1954244 RepID=A0A6J3YMG9_9TREM|nr:ATP synthase F0 subunit 6 [Posthodiplostomum centrarchi]
MKTNRLFIVYQNIISSFAAPTVDVFYTVVVSGLLIYLAMLRYPYIMEGGFFFFFLFSIIFPLFVSLFYSRLVQFSREFFASFVPSGTPLWIAWFVCLAETISYVVRPVVLVFRPFLNLMIGYYGMSAVASAVLFGGFFFCLLLILVCVFFYEIFVTLVHWFIVCSILDHSVSH